MVEASGSIPDQSIEKEPVSVM